MKSVILALVLLVAFPLFADGGSCGCETKVVKVHDHEGIQCEENEVMVGHDMENGVVKCGTVHCSCHCEPEKGTK